MTRALIPIADGTEEMEAVILIDTLRRGGWDVVSASVSDSLVIEASRRVKLVADVLWDDSCCSEIDVLVIAGGAKGTETLADDPRILKAVRDCHEKGAIIAAICAGPLVLQAAGILHGRRATCHPAVADSLTAAQSCDARVVIDGNIMTSQGPGTAFELSLALIERRDGQEAARRVETGLVL